MPFYHLTHSDYETDMESSRQNPVRLTGDRLWIPAIRCEHCGTEWGGSEHLRIPRPAHPEVLALLGGISLDPQQWAKVVADLASALRLDFAVLHPGMAVGPPRGEVCATIANDINHVSPGLLWVRRRVVDALHSLGSTGVTYQKVELEWAPPWDDFDDVIGQADASARWQPPEASPPDLWELVVSGKAWRKGVTLKDIQQCGACGKTWFPMLGYFEVDESRWDGSDFFHLDTNPNILMVTERIRDLFEEHGFSNYRCIPAQ